MHTSNNVTLLRSLTFKSSIYKFVDNYSKQPNTADALDSSNG